LMHFYRNTIVCTRTCLVSGYYSRLGARLLHVPLLALEWSRRPT
jgi:hypothetical protein